MFAHSVPVNTGLYNSLTHRGIRFAFTPSACVKLGYFADDFAHHFVRRAKRYPPLINRGRGLARPLFGST